MTKNHNRTDRYTDHPRLAPTGLVFHGYGQAVILQTDGVADLGFIEGFIAMMLIAWRNVVFMVEGAGRQL